MTKTLNALDKEEIWQSVKNSLALLTSCDTNSVSREKHNMALLQELKNRIAEWKEEIEELDRRKRILAQRIATMERAVEAEINRDCDYLDEEPTTSKAQIVRNLIKGAGSAGITVGEIKDELLKQGQSISRNFVYSTLARLREDGEATQEEDRYFWKAKTTA